MDRDLNETGLINQATTERLYGVQNAPSTFSGIPTPHDSVATRYDHEHPIDKDEAQMFKELIAPFKSDYPASVLDVGCGTGRVLDLGITSPDRYAGVDPSQPMLNMLVRKYPNVARIYPTTIEQALMAWTFTPGQFEIVVAYGSADELGLDTISALATLASRVLVLKRGGELELSDRRDSFKGVA